MKQILVTGGAGFIGSHLCERLLMEDNFVICMDNLSTGSMTNIGHLIGSSNFVFVNLDVCDVFPFYPEVAEIYNLACPASPVQYQADPIQTIRTSVLGALNMLERANKSGAKILQASTSEVYGEPAVHPQTESYHGNVNPIGVRSCYDESKRLVESLFINFSKQRGVSTKIVRIFNTYGPRMQVNDGRAVSNFIVQALRGEQLVVYGDGKQTRSFCYVDDMVEGLIRMMQTTNDITGPVNLGNPQEVSIVNLARVILLMTRPTEAKIIYGLMPEDDPTHRMPDISLAKEYLRWYPVIDLDEGLKRTLAYFKTVV
jgi:UDP-glucuronate decarboxylase